MMSSTWLSSSRKTVKIFDKKIVYVSGLDLDEADARLYPDEATYISAITARVKAQAAETRQGVGVFDDESGLELFSKSLSVDVKEMLSSSKADFKKEKQRIDSMLLADKKAALKAIEEAKAKAEASKKRSRLEMEIGDPATILSPVKEEPKEPTIDEQVDALFSCIAPFSKEKISFDSILQQIGLTISSTEGEDEWAIASNFDKSLRLERRIQDIINFIENFEAPKSGEVVFPAENLFQKRMADGIKQKSRDKMIIAEDFIEVPYDTIPDYDSQVKRPLSIEILTQKLKKHEYTSMYLFSRDFYEMLNNGRHFTLPGSKV
jgi:hypothetical protein